MTSDAKALSSAAVKGSGRNGRTSKISTPPVIAAPQAIDSDDEYSDIASPLAGGDDNDDEGVAHDPKIDKIRNKFTIESYSNNNNGSFGKRDYSYLSLKPDSVKRPLWIDPEKGHIIFERFSPLAAAAQDFLITIAEPLSRPSLIHEYALTTHSLYAAVSAGLSPRDIINTLDRFSKIPLPDSIRKFIESCTKSYGKVKLVLKNTKYFVESADAEMLQLLLKDAVIGPLRVHHTEGDIVTTVAPKATGLIIPGTKEAAGMKQASSDLTKKKAEGEMAPDEVYAILDEDDDDDDQEVTHSFEIPDSAVETVQKRCLDLEFPILEEYDFHHDEANANLEIDLRPNTQIRDYQEKSLSKMFGNSRAKSGIIVLPCGAGKTLVGITAACTIRKSCIVLCTSSMSVEQWRNEFLKWSNISPEDVIAFKADGGPQNPNFFRGNAGIIVTTYNMVTQSKERSHASKKMLDFVSSREWGLMLLDEVHVVPANIFRKVTSQIKTHAKLGLTATLLREDDKISHLNFLIGPKLFEANWMELSEQGHIAKVQCAEVWCPMPTEFYDEYLKAPPRKRPLLYTMNPRKFQACQYLINYHEARGDKIIVFSDNLYALSQYAKRMQKAYICGDTKDSERMRILANFQHNPAIKTLFLSKIGDTSLDLPEATCLIQISSQFGSRRQEAQRLGRILRAKRRNDEGFNAFFYTLVSKDTSEMYFASKRQAFLVDQGYAFKVITELANLDDTPDLAFSTPTERRELLHKLLLDNDSWDNEEKTDSMWNGSRAKKGGRGVKRRAGVMADFAGGQDMAYVEQNKKARKDKKADQSQFFKKINRLKNKK